MSDGNGGIDRVVCDYTVVCDNCGMKWDCKATWLENDPCMPERLAGP